MSAKDTVSASLIRRPTGAAPTSRAAATFQREDTQPPEGAGDQQPTTTPGGTKIHDGGAQQRTTVVYPVALKRGLKTAAAQQDTSMTDLVRAAVDAAMQDRDALIAAAPQYQRMPGTRTTIDLPADQHKTLNVWAAQEDTTANALILAAIYRKYPDMAT